MSGATQLYCRHCNQCWQEVVKGEETTVKTRHHKFGSPRLNRKVTLACGHTRFVEEVVWQRIVPHLENPYGCKESNQTA